MSLRIKNRYLMFRYNNNTSCIDANDYILYINNETRLEEEISKNMFEHYYVFDQLNREIIINI